MDKIAFMSLTKIYLEKFFPDSEIVVTNSMSDKNKINFLIKGKNKHAGSIFHQTKLTNKDIRNILFSFKRRLYNKEA